jgi:hypothetical protein
MMQRVLKNNWQAQWITAMLVFLFAGLLISRALVSFASVLMVVPFFFSYKQMPLKKTVLTATVLLLLPVMLSGLWSDDKILWWNSVSVKLPFVTMLLGLSAAQLSEHRWRQLVCIYIIMITLGCCWSLLQYANNSAEIQASYLKAKLLPTPADDDHLRFSWMVIIAIVLGFKILPATQKSIRYLRLFIRRKFGLPVIYYVHSKKMENGYQPACSDHFSSDALLYTYTNIAQPRTICCIRFQQLFKRQSYAWLQ